MVRSGAVKIQNFLILKKWWKVNETNFEPQGLSVLYNFFSVSRIYERSGQRLVNSSEWFPRIESRFEIYQQYCAWRFYQKARLFPNKWTDIKTLGVVHKWHHQGFDWYRTIWCMVQDGCVAFSHFPFHILCEIKTMPCRLISIDQHFLFWHSNLSHQCVLKSSTYTYFDVNL